MPEQQISVKVGKELIVDCYDVAFRSLYETIVNNDYVDADDIDFFIQHLESLIVLILESSAYKEKDALNSHHSELVLDMVEAITSLEKHDGDYFDKALKLMTPVSDDIYFICHPERLGESPQYSTHELFQLDRELK